MSYVHELLPKQSLAPVIVMEGPVIIEQVWPRRNVGTAPCCRREAVAPIPFLDSGAAVSKFRGALLLQKELNPSSQS